YSYYYYYYYYYYILFYLIGYKSTLLTYYYHYLILMRGSNPSPCVKINFHMWKYLIYKIKVINYLLLIPLNLAIPGTYQLTQLQLQYLYYHVQPHIVRNTDHKILPVFLLWLMSGSVYLVLNRSLGLVTVHRNHE
ncbi:hypothetical protein CROQUDRAFT_703802, partial [Cronartium quercuum f. sp. fusiforme G11]